MNRFLQNTPFFRLFISLSLGIVLHEFGLGLQLFISVAVLSIVLLLLYRFAFKESLKVAYHWLFGVAVFFAFISVGGTLAELRQTKNIFSHRDKKGVFIVEVLEQPVEKTKSTLCKVKLLSFSDDIAINETAVGKAVLYMPKDSISRTVSANDILLLRTTFRMPEKSKNPGAFDYGTFLRRKGFGATAYARSGDWKKITSSDHFSVFTLAENCRSYLLRIYERFDITGDEFGILAALTLGYKEALTDEVRERFGTTGAMHVLAVSGLHVGILYLVFGWMLCFLDKGRKGKLLRNILLIVLLCAYAFLTGLSPSVSRATFMFSLMALANILERKIADL